MAKGIGKLLQVGIAKEAVRGTATSAASYWIPWSEMSVDEATEFGNNEMSLGLIEDSTEQFKLAEKASAEITAPIGDKHFPLILLAALGALSTGDNADADASVKDHTVTVSQSAEHQALTLFSDDPLGGQDYKFALGALESLEIKYEMGKLLHYTAVFRSKKGETATLTPATTAAENRFLPQHTVFKLATNLAGLTAASAMSIKSLNLKIEKNLEDDQVLGNIAPVNFLNKNLQITGTIEALWQNESDYKTAYLANTAKAMRIDLVNTDTVIGTAANPRVKIDLAKVQFSELTRAVAVGDIVKQTLGFKAHYSTSDTQMISAIVTNVVASY